MKNNTTTKRSKGFYIALYGCLGLLVAGGAALSISLTTNHSEQAVPNVPVDTFATAPNLPSTGLPVPPVSDQTAGIREFFNIGEENAPAENENQTTPDTSPEQPATGSITDDHDDDDNATSDQTEPNETTEEALAPVEEDSVPVFHHFADGDVMFWPVLGEIVMDYSSDHFIFDPTLNQWRTNDKINIASEVGSVVRAAAEGLVISISSDARLGNMITIDHGNGLSSTYSQIDNITVSEGDVVAGGQIIAHVAQPTIFASGLGDNVGFRVTLDNTTMNPLAILQQ